MIGNQIYKCAEYKRLSKEDFGKCDESSSISSQGMIIRSFAKHNGLNIVKEYVDDGYSGGNFERPAFSQMIQDIEDGLINCVITKDLSRLGREMYGTGKYIEEYFLEHNVRYIAINDSYDSLIGDSMLGLRLGVNDLYLRDVSKKVKSSFRVKQERGDYIGSFPCYGYKKDPNDKHKLIIDPEASKVVRLIYSLALEGNGVCVISRILSEKKIPIPIVYKKEPRGLKVTENDGCGIWKHSTIRNILKSQMYIGNMVQHTHEKISYNNKKCRKVKDSEYIIVENTHEPIISKEDFEKVQEILKDRHTTSKERNFDRYLLSGLLVCGNCGRTLGIGHKKNRQTQTNYTSCNNYNRKGKISGCTPNRLNYDLLEKDIVNYLKDIGEEFIKHYNTRELVEDSVYIYNKDVLSMKNEIDSLNTKIKKELDTISSLYNDKVEGHISLEVYKNLSKKHEDNLQELNKEKDLKESRYQSLANSTAEMDFTKCRELVESYVSMKNPSRTLIKNLINNIVIYDNGDEKTVKVNFKFKALSYFATTIKD